MNTDIARNRYKEVLRVDVTANSRGDFLATHVPFKNLYLADKLTVEAKLFPKDQKKKYSEDEIYRRVAEPSSEDRFTLVTGTNGSGKSHLIRWLANMLKIREAGTEVVLFIKRNDNTLKGTIRQLLNMPEVQQIPNREQYKRLVQATRTVTESELKNTILSGFINKIKDDIDGNGQNEPGDDKDQEEKNILKKDEKKGLVALLQNADFEKQLKAEGGPVERIYSKIAESDQIQDSDTIAQFKPQDFYIDVDLFDRLLSGADFRAKKIARKLTAVGFDQKTQEIAHEISLYMNSFMDRVIQDCAGLQAGDMQQIFADIRKELYRQGKNLTILVEDITSFTGVNAALLQALMTPHSGGYASEKYCRINAIVGSTDGYYHDNFRDNFKERITQFVWVPGDIFDNDLESLYEFFARYLNTMSLTNDEVESWVKDGASPENYPYHRSNVGQFWDTYPINGQNISLYPFSKHAIAFLYKNCDAGKKTPRRIMQDLILPFVEEILNAPSKFPARDILLNGKDYNLRNSTRAVEKDPNYLRLIRFMTVWGDGTNEITLNGGREYIGGIDESIYNDLHLPVVKGKLTSVNKQKRNEYGFSDDHESGESLDNQDSEKPEISPEQLERLNWTTKELSKWINSKKDTLEVGSNTPHLRDLNDARRNINNYLYNVIDWQAEGVPNDVVRILKKRKEKFFVSFERQRSGNKGIIELPADNESMLLIEAFVKWSVLGKQSWNYTGFYGDLLNVQIWTEKVKPLIIKAVMEENGKPINYFSYAAAIEAYRLLFNGYPINTKQLNFDSMVKGLMTDYDVRNSGHGKEWTSFAERLSGAEGDLFRESFFQYYNLPQGDNLNSKNYILDRLELDRAVRKVNKYQLKFTSNDLQLDDPNEHRRKFSTFLQEIQEKIPEIVKTEKAQVKECISKLADYIDLDDLESDDIKDLGLEIREFYSQANASRISLNLNGSSPEITNFSKSASQISNALKIGQEILQTNDVVDLLAKLSSDPMKNLAPLLENLQKIEKDIQKANSSVVGRSSNLADSSNITSQSYAEEMNLLNECDQYLGGDN